jgi:hypothetical protein
MAGSGLGGYFRDGRSRWCASVVSALVLLSVFAASASAATADISPFTLREYRQDFPSLSTQQAEERLETQQRGAGIVAQLKLALGKEYAGVWFDNETGQFVIPLLSTDDRPIASKIVTDTGLAGEFHFTSATSSWDELEVAHREVDEGLQSNIEAGQVETLLDPVANAVVVREAGSAGLAVKEEVQRSANAVDVVVRARPDNRQRLNIELRSCGNFLGAWFCDKPLRGGASIEPDFSKEGFGYTGLCTAGFKAIGNGNRFILTAGHCARSVVNWASRPTSKVEKPIGAVEASSFPIHDWAKIKASGSYWDTSPWPSQVAHFSENQEQSIFYEGYSYVGQYVCHSGTKTGTSCGAVRALDVTGDSGEGLIYHLTEFGEVCGINGDSGGPVFAGSTAYGLYSAGDPTGAECPLGSGKSNGEYGYYLEITEATSAMGVTVGTRVGGAPSATTNAATGVASAKATLNGAVNPNGVETQYYFQYGTTTGYGGTIPIPSGNAGHGTGTVGVNVVLPGLKPLTTYHYRVVASSAAGTVFGSDVQFTTSALPILGEDDNFGGAHTVVQPDGTIDVFYRTPTGGLGHNAYVNGVWGQPPLAGSLASSSVPHPVVQANGTIDVFYRTPTGGLGHNAYVNGNWGQDVLPGSLASDPHAVAQANGTIDVFYRTPTGGLGHTVYLNGAWSLAPLPGSVAGDPYPVVQANGTIDVFYRTPTGGLGHNAYVNGGWGQPALPGSLASSSDPHPVVQANGTIDVFYRTPTGGLGHNAYVNGGWGQPPLPGSLASDPHAVVQANGTIDVFYRTPTGGLGHTVYVNGAWSLAPLPGSVAGDPYPVVQADGTLDIFYRTPSGGLGHNAYVKGSWGQPPLAGSLDPTAGMGVHAVAQANGTVDVFYRTPTGGLGHNAYVNGVWGQDILPGEL